MMKNNKCLKRFLSSIFLLTLTALPAIEPNNTSHIAVAADGDFTLAISTRDGLFLFDPSGLQVGSIDESNDFEVCEDSLFFLSSSVLLEYDPFGNQLKTIPIPPEVIFKNRFVVLPDLDFAFFDNENDKIYFIDYEGNYLAI